LIRNQNFKSYSDLKPISKPNSYLNLSTVTQTLTKNFEVTTTSSQISQRLSGKVAWESELQRQCCQIQCW